MKIVILFSRNRVSYMTCDFHLRRKLVFSSFPLKSVGLI